MELNMQIVKQFLLNEDDDADNGKLRENFMFSPFSVHTLLCMVASGMKGPTLEHLLFLLGLESVADLNSKAADPQVAAIFANFDHDENAKGPTISSVNGSWIDKKYTLDHSFHQLLQILYKADFSTVDFENKTREAIDEINTWAQKATKGLIRNLLPYHGLTKKTAFILANALYFKGDWAHPFDESKTRCDNFYALTGDILQVPTMESSHEHYLYASSKGFKILGLNYENYWNTDNGKGKFAMYIFLPDEKEGLLELLDQFGSNPDLLSVQFKFDMVEIRRLSVPKFKFKCKFPVSKMMKRLGLTLSLNIDAEILEAVDGDVHFEDAEIFHTSCIAIDEYGTEAAAVTYEEYMSMSLATPPVIDFVADHPFIFMIREDSSKTPIFLGAVVNPLLEESDFCQ